MAEPRYRLCEDCLRAGKEEPIATADAPMVQIGIGMMHDSVSYDAQLPRWIWRLWARLNTELVSVDDGAAGELITQPGRHELCAACLTARLQVPGATDLLTQREYRDECRKAMASVDVDDVAAAGV